MFVSQRSLLLLLLISVLSFASAQAQREMENLDRGVVAVNRSGGVYVGWRMLGLEPESVAYNVYRNDTRINSSPIADSTNFLDTNGNTGSQYSVAAVIGGVEQPRSEAVQVWSDFYRDIPFQRPPGGVTPDGVSYTYSPNDCSAGDLDGDGEYEIIVKWDPSNSKDNANNGYTGNVYLDAYKMDGSFLWRIDVGVNIRAGAHYTQFMVYDLDGDGRAEIALKTAPGSRDGTGAYVGGAARWQNAGGGARPGFSDTADHRNASGRVLSGPEFFTIFDGLTGEELVTTNYIPPRGTVSSWGDSNGNRVDRFLACVAYLDGGRPSVVMCRGYYTRTVLAAWDFRGGQLTQRWVFDSSTPGNSAYAGQGNHNLSVADVDGDGRDEIVYGSMCVDDNGTGLYSTGIGHGDAMHVAKMDPNRPGLQVWSCHEQSPYGASYRDAGTGAVIFRHTAGGDTGRGVAAHIDSRYPGYQIWSSAPEGVYHNDQTQISPIGFSGMGNMLNFLIWWDGDLQREFLNTAGSDGNPILEKWNGNGSSRVLSLYSFPTSWSTKTNNGSKATPCLSGDLFGDWREEVIYRSSDNNSLRVFTTTGVTGHRIRTLMHDPQYWLAIAWQNVGYNQPPHPSFYIGAGMSDPPMPDIVYTAAIGPPDAPGGLVATGAGSDRIQLAWEGGLTGGAFRVERSTDGVNFTSIPSGNVGATTYLDTGLDPETTYYYRVRAFNGMFSEYTSVARAATSVNPLPVTHVSTGKIYALGIAAVGNLYYTDRNYAISSLSANLDGNLLILQANDDKGAATATHLTFTLGAPATVYVAYDRRVTSLPGFLNDWTLTGESLASAGDAAATPFRVYSRDFPAGPVTLGGNMQSPAAGAQTNYVVMVKFIGPPVPPTGLSATPGDNQVGLNWNAPNPANIKRATTSGGPYTTIGSTTTSSYTDTTAGNGETYYYVVSTVNSFGESEDSEEVSAEPGDINGDGIPDNWQAGHFGDADHPDAAPDADPDGDGTSNLVEYRLGLDPTNAASSFKAEFSGQTLTWPSAEGIVFIVWRNLTLGGEWENVGTVTGGPGNTASFTDPQRFDRAFYRIEIDFSPDPGNPAE